MKIFAALVLGLIFLSASGAAMAGAPTDEVRDTVDKVLAIVREPQPASEGDRTARRDKLREVISQRFDFAEMARRSLGRSWRRLNAEQQEEFVRLFTRLLEDSYLDKIEYYQGEKVRYGRESQDNDYAQVDTRIIAKDGKDYSVNYRLLNANGTWKVYDVVIEDISLVNNYRAQFNHVLAKSSVDELLNRMRQRTISAPT
jgi:phospholipid transport system substrate-binding protein